MTDSKGKGTSTAARVFRTIWRSPRISRVGIAERLGLDKSTVTNQVNRLIDMELIEEVAEGSASERGGRRPIHLGIRKSFGRILGVEIQLESYLAVVVDLAGEILSVRSGAISLDERSFPETVSRIVAEASGQTGREPGPLLGAGIGAGGLIDHRKNLIRYSVPLDIPEQYDFGRRVAAGLEIPCSIENDANCCAWGELAFNRGEELRDFLFALVEFRRSPPPGRFGGLGVGFGIALGGKVYAGAHGNAGEFRSAFCDGRGELQFSLGREELGRLPSDGEVMRRVTDELSRNVAMLVNTMDFDRVYIGGDIEGLPVDVPAVLRRRLEENWMYPCPNGVEIRYSSLGEKAVAYGAAGMILDRLVTEGLLPGIGAREEPGR